MNTITGQTITVPITSTSAGLPTQTYNNCTFLASLVDWRSGGWLFQNCKFYQPCDGIPLNTVFRNCIWSGPNAECKVQNADGVQFYNSTFMQTVRGIIVQTAPGKTVSNLLVQGLQLIRIGFGSNTGAREWFLAEGPGGSFINSTISEVNLIGCPGQLTMDNLNVSNVTFSQINGQSGGVLVYQTPGQAGTVTGLAMKYWRHQGGNVNLTGVVNSTWANIYWDTPSFGPTPKTPVLVANGGTHTLDYSVFSNLYLMLLASGFSVGSNVMVENP